MNLGVRYLAVEVPDGGTPKCNGSYMNGGLTYLSFFKHHFAALLGLKV